MKSNNPILGGADIREHLARGNVSTELRHTGLVTAHINHCNNEILGTLSNSWGWKFLSILALRPY